VIGAYHRLVAEMVGRVGGVVAKYMGDGIVVYFGYPQAHESASRDLRTASKSVPRSRCISASAQRSCVTSVRSSASANRLSASPGSTTISGRSLAHSLNELPGFKVCSAPGAAGRAGAWRELLAPIYGWFTEGFDTPVLQNAGYRRKKKRHDCGAAGIPAFRQPGEEQRSSLSCVA